MTQFKAPNLADLVAWLKTGDNESLMSCKGHWVNLDNMLLRGELHFSLNEHKEAIQCFLSCLGQKNTAKNQVTLLNRIGICFCESNVSPQLIKKYTTKIDTKNSNFFLLCGKSGKYTPSEQQALLRYNLLSLADVERFFKRKLTFDGFLLHWINRHVAELRESISLTKFAIDCATDLQNWEVVDQLLANADFSTADDINAFCFYICSHERYHALAERTSVQEYLARHMNGSIFFKCFDSLQPHGHKIFGQKNLLKQTYRESDIEIFYNAFKDSSARVGFLQAFLSRYVGEISKVIDKWEKLLFTLPDAFKLLPLMAGRPAVRFGIKLFRKQPLDSNKVLLVPSLVSVGRYAAAEKILLSADLSALTDGNDQHFHSARSVIFSRDRKSQRLRKFLFHLSKKSDLLIWIVGDGGHRLRFLSTLVSLKDKKLLDTYSVVFPELRALVENPQDILFFASGRSETLARLKLCLLNDIETSKLPKLRLGSFGSSFEVILASNDAYLPGLFVQLLSLRLFQPVLSLAKINIWLSSDDYQLWTGKLKKLIRKLGLNVTFHNGGSYLHKINSGRKQYGFDTKTDLDLSAYLRLFALKHHRASCSDLIYFDCDAIFSDVEFQIPNFDVPLMARVDDVNEAIIYAAETISVDPLAYFNSGVLAYSHRQDTDDRLQAAIELVFSDEKLVFHDQCALNKAFAGYFSSLAVKNNCFIRPSSSIPSDVNEAAFIHFLEKPKPWMIGYDGEFLEFYQLAVKKLIKLVGKDDVRHLFAKALF